jgi:hypothetical protein
MWCAPECARTVAYKGAGADGNLDLLLMYAIGSNSVDRRDAAGCSAIVSAGARLGYLPEAWI